MGINLEPDFIVANDIRAGRLVPLLPGYALPAININSAYPSRRHLSAKVRTFIDFLVLRFANAPPWRLSDADWQSARRLLPTTPAGRRRA